MTPQEPPSSGSIIVMLCLLSSIGRYVLDSYLPSMPAIASFFAISADNVQLTISYYLFGFSISQLIYGPLSDSFGRKKTLIVGLSIFTVASMACSFVGENFTALLFFRLLAGVGAGSCGVLNRAIASDCFKGEKFSKAWSYTTSTLVLTLILAPLMGAYVQEIYNWQANFMISTAYVALILLIVIRFLPETHAEKMRCRWNTVSTIKNYISIAKTRSFIVPTLCYTLAFSGLIAYFQISPFLFIDGFGLSPIQYGYTSIVIACCYLAGGLMVSHLVTRLGPKLMLKLGLFILSIAGLSLLFFYSFGFKSLSAVLFSISLYVVGARIVIANAIAEAFAEVRQQGGTASALIGCIQMSGAATVSSLVAQFQHPSLLLLGFCLSTLGFSSLFIYYYFSVRPSTTNHDESEVAEQIA